MMRPMMEITTINSTRVKAFVFKFILPINIYSIIPV